MPLADIIKKKERMAAVDSPTVQEAAVPAFTFMRSDTFSQNIIHPETFAAPAPPTHTAPENDNSQSPPRSKLSHIIPHRSPSHSAKSPVSPLSPTGLEEPERPGVARRISQRLGLRKRPSSSNHVPEDLPDIAPVTGKGEEVKEAEWEKRATMLAVTNEKVLNRPVTPQRIPSPLSLSGDAEVKTVGSRETDDNIQEAIRLHEAGDLKQSTNMFGRLADPSGENNALSQVLYGLALRHGWGCTPDVTKAVTYLSAAASNAANVESLALQAGLRKGGAAKGELILAIFELANCFRHGWGVKEDPVAAKQYYETAANLGDTDAMNEVAWCYLQGFGCKKDKGAAAKYLRLAEKGGSKTLGNSWVWKEKYDPK